MTLPNFIVIGAAKAGTTAFYWYFAEHPAVYMSPVKETNFFAYGVDSAGRLVYGDPDVHHFPVTSLSAYEALFAAAGTAAAIGEVSPIYLECPEAAGRIRALLPAAKLVCCLRDPVDRAYSDYLMYLRNRGRRLDPARDLMPGAAWLQPDSHWMRIGFYHQQLARYYDAFPRDQIHVLLFDDLKRNLSGAVQDLYRFVGVAPDFTPDFDTPHNVGGMPASVLLERILTKSAIKSVVAPWMPKGATNWLRQLRTRTMRKPPALSAELRRQAARHFHEDLTSTSALIGRSLDHWR